MILPMGPRAWLEWNELASEATDDYLRPERMFEGSCDFLRGWEILWAVQWPGMCEAVLAIDSGAWDEALSGPAGDEVTVEVTVEWTTNESPLHSWRMSGARWSGKRDLNPSPARGSGARVRTPAAAPGT